MRVLVASDGNVSVDEAVRVAAPLAGGDPIRLMTVVEIPRSLLADLRSAYEDRAPGSAIDTDAEYVTATAAPPELSPAWPGDDVMLDRYVELKTRARLEPLAQAFATAGVSTESVALESESPARAILESFDEWSPDVLCIGGQGRGRFESLMGGTGTKLVRHAPCSVLVVKSTG